MQCIVGKPKQYPIKKSTEVSKEESDSDEDCYSSDEETVVISAQTDIDSDEGEHSETEQSDVSLVQNSSINDISDLFSSHTRSGRVAGSWRRSLDEWLD